MKLCFELIVNLIRNINRNRNILKTISSRGLSMNNIVRLGYRYPSLSLSFLHFLDTTLYLFPRVSGFETTRQIRFPSFTRDSNVEQEFDATQCRRCRCIFFTSRNLSFSLVLSYRSKRIANNSYRIMLSIA